MKILNIINDLNRGGAETALVRQSERLHEMGDDVSVICLKSAGELGFGLVAQGISVQEIGLKFGPTLPVALFRLVKAIRATDADVVQTWLYHSNLIGGIASRFAKPRTPLVWGVHHSILKRESSKRTTRIVSRVSALLSHVIPRRIVYCANISRTTHEVGGYSRSKGEVVPNGISIEQFRPDRQRRAAKRTELGIGEHERVIGLVARNHPDKDVPTFIRAAGLLADSEPDVRFVLVGRDLDNANVSLKSQVEATGHAERFLLVGASNDVPALLNAFDIGALSSITEAFPIAVIEAMAAGLPVVSTDVGDVREVIDVTGRVVAVGDAAGMAAAWLELLRLHANLFAALGVAAREHVEQHYRLERTVDLYRSIYRNVIGPVAKLR